MSARTPTPLTSFAFVGNLGCVRFAPPVRKAAGVKRGDRLVVLPQADGSILLEKLEAPAAADVGQVTVEACACEQPPELCGRGPREVVTVGWSYVQLNRELASELGFLPGAGLRLVAEAGQITMSPHDDRADLDGVEAMRCPP